MQTKKMSLANIQGKLSRAEMKNVLAGNTKVVGGCAKFCERNSDCGGDMADCPRCYAPEGGVGQKYCQS